MVPERRIQACQRICLLVLRVLVSAFAQVRIAGVTYTTAMLWCKLSYIAWYAKLDVPIVACARLYIHVLPHMLYVTCGMLYFMSYML